VPQPLWIIGHRGSPTEEVENTLPSFERALRDEGANALELDVSLTRDGELVVWHDFDPSALAPRLRRWELEPHVRFRPRAPADGRHRPISEMTLAEVREQLGYVRKDDRDRRVDAHIPTLGEVFSAAAGWPSLGMVFVDVKVPEGREELLPRILARLDALERATGPRFTRVLETAVPEVAREILRLEPRRLVAIDVEPPAGIVLDVAKTSAVDAAVRLGCAWAMAQKARPVTLLPFATHRRVVRRDLRRMQDPDAASVEGFGTFTINDEDEMRTLLCMGVRAIQTDMPALLRDVAERLSSPAPAGVSQGLREIGPTR
jgi:glycerophosphoryl diester phosphodiesterase